LVGDFDAGLMFHLIVGIFVGLALKGLFANIAGVHLFQPAGLLVKPLSPRFSG
jgi:hypothetical protein